MATICIKESAGIKGRTGLAFAAALALLVGCGGGGGGGGSAPTPTPVPTPTPTPTPNPATTLSGTVAKGAALAGYQVTVVSIKSMEANWANGHGNSGQIGSATTDSNGHYSVSLDFMPPPYLIIAAKNRDTADENYPRLFSVALSAGTANVTPLTDLLTTQLFGKSFNDIFSSDINYSALTNLSQTQIDNARQAVVEYLLHRPNKYQQFMTTSIVASPIDDFIATAFQLTGSDPYNAVLDDLQDGLVEGENIFAMEMHMLDHSIGATDIAALAPVGLHCDTNNCGVVTNDYRVVAPYYSKYALLKALYLQFDQHGIAQLDCGNAPTIAGLHAGINTFYIDDTVLRINDLSPSGNGAYSLLSATALDLAVAASTTGGSNFLSYANIRSDIKAHEFRIDMQLGETSVTAIEFRLNGATDPITCTR
ncbi:MAG TPA: carboxypeptidase-like regulatory domain-containing protein [Spongiibacteraceae bacterium]|nr:carboxypeptidase-like regulatory domain-containing protein [Spongiibacteraceae bacterium]